MSPSSPRREAGVRGWLRNAFRGPTLVFAGGSLIAGIAVVQLRGTERATAAIVDAAAMSLGVLPQVVLGLMLGAVLQQLVPHETVGRYLGRESGLRGLVVGTLLGCVTPGGPFASFPIVYALFVAGAEAATLVTYLAAWALIGVNRMIVWELPFMGAEFAVFRWLICLPLPLLAGLLARAIVTRTRLKPEAPEAGR